jgi:hypothetical protein
MSKSLIRVKKGLDLVPRGDVRKQDAEDGGIFNLEAKITVTARPMDVEWIDVQP